MSTGSEDKRWDPADHPRVPAGHGRASGRFLSTVDSILKLLGERPEAFDANPSVISVQNPDVDLQPGIFRGFQRSGDWVEIGTTVGTERGRVVAVGPTVVSLRHEPSPAWPEGLPIDVNYDAITSIRRVAPPDASGTIPESQRFGTRRPVVYDYNYFVTHNHLVDQDVSIRLIDGTFQRGTLLGATTSTGVRLDDPHNPAGPITVPYETIADVQIVERQHVTREDWLAGAPLPGPFEQANFAPLVGADVTVIAGGTLTQGVLTDVRERDYTIRMSNGALVTTPYDQVSLIRRGADEDARLRALQGRLSGHLGTPVPAFEPPRSVIPARQVDWWDSLAEAHVTITTTDDDGVRHRHVGQVLQLPVYGPIPRVLIEDEEAGAPLGILLEDIVSVERHPPQSRSTLITSQHTIFSTRACGSQPEVTTRSKARSWGRRQTRCRSRSSLQGFPVSLIAARRSPSPTRTSRQSGRSSHRPAPGHLVEGSSPSPHRSHSSRPRRAQEEADQEERAQGEGGRGRLRLRVQPTDRGGAGRPCARLRGVRPGWPVDQDHCREQGRSHLRDQGQGLRQARQRHWSVQPGHQLRHPPRDHAQRLLLDRRQPPGAGTGRCVLRPERVGAARPGRRGDHDQRGHLGGRLCVGPARVRLGGRLPGRVPGTEDGELAKASPEHRSRAVARRDRGLSGAPQCRGGPSLGTGRLG